MSSARYVWELSRLVLGYEANGHVAVLAVYLDESGVHDGSPVITVAGYVGTPRVWREWTKRWNQRKRPIKVFHATDCAQHQGEFAAWDQTEKNKFVANLLPVITEAEIIPFAVGIRLNDYRESIAEFPGLERMIGPTPHTACFQWVMQSIIEALMAEGYYRSGGAVAVVHERNDYQADAVATFGWLCEKHSPASRNWSLTSGRRTAMSRFKLPMR